MTQTVWIVAGILFLIWIWNSLHTIKEGERGVVMRLGKIRPEPLLPGLRMAYWPVETVYRVSVEPQTWTIVPRELVAKGDAEIKAGATCCFRVVDAGRWLAMVSDCRFALGELAKQRMLQVVGQFSVEEVLYGPAALNEQIRQSLQETAREWGLEILSFEIKSEAH